MKHFTTIFITLLFFYSVKAQDYQIDWQNAIGGSDADSFTSMKVTPDGGYILGGLSISNISGDKTENSMGLQDYWVVKTDAQGLVQWDNTIGGNDLDQLIDLAPTSDGGYILAGSSRSEISGDKTEASIGSLDYWLVKLNAAGTIEWQRTLGGSDVDFLRTVTETSDGGFFLGGYSRSDISGDKTENSKGGLDYWVVKVTSLGVVEWDKTIGGAENEFLFSSIQTSDGGFLFGGISYSDASGDKTENAIGVGDFWLVKLDAAGALAWENTIGGNGLDAPAYIIEATGGGFIVGGESNSDASGDKTENSLGETDFWVIKIDTLGSIVWQQTIGGAEEDAIKSIANTVDGGFILGGFSNSNISGDKTENSRGSYDYWIVKIKDTGTIDWEKTIGGSEDDRLFSVQQLANGNYVLGGYSSSDISGDKTDGSVGETDYWILQVSEVLGLSETAFEASVRVYPNPSNKQVSISVGENFIDAVQVYSTNGQVLDEVVNVASEKILLDVSAFVQGVYYIKITSEGKEIIKKFMKE